MTAYKNFIQDFPTRCCKMLNRYGHDAQSHGREVTLTLAMAASGLVVPFERLRPWKKLPPPYQDRSNYLEAVLQFDNLLKEKFLSSRLWKKGVSSWAFGGVRCVTKDPGDWPELQEPRNPLHPCKGVRSTLEHLRNALAHGNILTLPKDASDIDLIVFLSRKGRTNPKFQFLCVTPQDFQQFLKKWFVFVSELQLPPIGPEPLS